MNNPQTASIDGLTQLANRSGWLQAAEAALLKDKDHKVMFFIDLDRFKFVNDSLGHDAGDLILKNAAELIQSEVNCEVDLVGRMGGDEFVALLSDSKSVAFAEDIANQIIYHLSQPVLVNDTEVEIGASIGISHFPKDATKLEELIKFADLAMYRAKHSGRNQQVSFHEQMVKKIKYRRDVQMSIRKALKEETLLAMFQPIYDVRKENTVAVELSVDCDLSDGLVSIDQEELFSIADESQVAIELSEWMFEQAAMFLANMQEAGEEIEVITSIRPSHFHQKNFVNWLTELLEEYEVSPENVVIQLNDNCLNSMRFPVEKQLHELSRLGVVIAVQNFGTGQLSPLKLHDWPIDQLHLSSAFINEMSSKTSIAAMTAALIKMGLMLNKKVVAYGVSSLEQQAMLTSNQCYSMQGALFGEVMTAAEFEDKHLRNDLGFRNERYLGDVDDMDEF